MVDPMTALAVVVFAVDVGIVVAIAVMWAMLGRDPVELDDDSVLAAGPPDRVSPCLAVVLHDGRGERRVLSVALLELAARGVISIHDAPTVGEGAYYPRPWVEVASRTRRDKLVLGPPESLLATALHVDQRDAVRLDTIDYAMAIAGVRTDFDDAIDDELVEAGWYRAAPFRTEEGWLQGSKAVIIIGVVGAALSAVAFAVPLAVAFVGLAFAGWFGRIVASVMPARTRAGARVAAMLEGYRRTLRRTLEMADSVWDVLDVPELAWFRTPDRMIVWAMALDLEGELAAMFARAERAPASVVWFPDWYGTTVRDPQRMFRSLDHLTGSAARSASPGNAARGRPLVSRRD